MSAIPEVKVCKIGRECNKVAHELAQLAKHVCIRWFGEINLRA